MTTTNTTDYAAVGAQREMQARFDLEAHIAHYARRLDQIEERLNQLDNEWDVEQALEANAGIAGLAGIALAILTRRWRWGLLSAAALGFLVQQAFNRTSPPARLFRRMGLRTAREIDQERYALKALRGDFRDLAPEPNEDVAAKAAKALDAIGLPAN